MRQCAVLSRRLPSTLLVHHPCMGGLVQSRELLQLVRVGRMKRAGYDGSLGDLPGCVGVLPVSVVCSRCPSGTVVGSLCDCVFLHRLHLHQTAELPQRHGRCSWLQSQSCFRRRKCPVEYRTAARKVQGRLLAGLGQRGDRVLVSSSAGVHTALGVSNRAQHTRWLARRLPLHNSAVPEVNGPGRTIAHGAAPQIASVAAALLPNRAIPSHLTDGLPLRHGRCSWLQCQSCFRCRKCPTHHDFPACHSHYAMPTATETTERCRISR